MIPQLFVESIDLGDGRNITIETGRLAKQADGSVVVRIGKTVILGTVVSARKASPGIDFLPLTVDYREKFAAAGRFPGGFFKREARPSDSEVLTMRLVDRVLRPLFPSDYHAEVQVMIQLMSHDEDVMPDALAGLAASAALALSDIPFETLISEARVGRIDGKFIINPSRAQLELSDIDMMIGASKDSIAMVEGEMKEISEKEMVEAIKFAHEHIKVQIDAQERLAQAFGKKEVRTYETEKNDDAIYAKVKAAAYDKIYAIASKGSAKHERSAAFDAVKEEVKALFTEEELAENGDLVSKYFYKTNKEAVRNVTLDLGTRLDGRKTTEIRPIWSEVNYLPSVHGSALFTRGETQALATATLGTSREANQIDSPSEQGEEKFYLHYNFPPFSTGEARPLRGTSRREVGHGNLAQRALKNMIPADCPYTIRVVSEVLESNGSSSMATVCAGTLALMDGGIQITSPVSGIAMGLVADDGKFAVTVRNGLVEQWNLKTGVLIKDFTIRETYRVIVSNLYNFDSFEDEEDGENKKQQIINNIIVEKEIIERTQFNLITISPDGNWVGTVSVSSRKSQPIGAGIAISVFELWNLGENSSVLCFPLARCTRAYNGYRDNDECDCLALSLNAKYLTFSRNEDFGGWFSLYVVDLEKYFLQTLASCQLMSGFFHLNLFSNMFTIGGIFVVQ